MGEEMDLNTVKQDRSFDYKYLYQRMLPYIRPYILRAIIGLAIAIPAGLIDSVMPMALKYYLDDILGQNNVSLDIFVPIAIILFAAIQGILRYVSTYMNDWSGRKITNYVQIHLFEK